MKGRGQPKADIDWDKVDELLICGCSGAEVAAELDIHKNTIYQRCKEDKGIHFSVYVLQKKQKGNSILKECQFNKAIGRSSEGDNTLLIWLGKQRLEQQERSLKEKKEDLELQKEKIEFEQSKKDTSQAVPPLDDLLEKDKMITLQNHELNLLKEELKKLKENGGIES